MAFSFVAHFVEVRVELTTRRIRVSRVVSIADCGRVAGPVTAASQMRGAVVWGIGASLRERSEADPRYGGFLNADLAEYVVPVNADVPDIDVDLIDIPDPRLNALGVKGLGEVAMVGVAAAIVNAVFHATEASRYGSRTTSEPPGRPSNPMDPWRHFHERRTGRIHGPISTGNVNYDADDPPPISADMERQATVSTRWTASEAESKSVGQRNPSSGADGAISGTHTIAAVGLLPRQHRRSPSALCAVRHRAPQSPRPPGLRHRPPDRRLDGTAGPKHAHGLRRADRRLEVPDQRPDAKYTDAFDAVFPATGGHDVSGSTRLRR